MKKTVLLLLAGFPLLGTEMVAAQSFVQAQAKVNQVKVYQKGGFMRLTATADLKAGENVVTLPDLWNVLENTLQVQLAPSSPADDVRFVLESYTAVHERNVNLYRTYSSNLDTLATRREKLSIDSLVLARRMDFLRLNMEQKNSSVPQMQSADKYLSEQYKQIYTEQKKLGGEMKKYDQHAARIRQSSQLIKENLKDITIARLQVFTKTAREVEFEVTYYTDAAWWKPVYFFRFDLDKPIAELDFQANIVQWTSFAWMNIPVELSYSRPWARTPYLSRLYRRQVRYYPPERPSEQKVTSLAIKKQERNLQVLDLDRDAEMASYDDGPARLRVSQTDVSYELKDPVTLRYAGPTEATAVTVPVKQHEVPVFFTYEVVPASSSNVILSANIPNWRQYYLTDGDVNVFCDGQILAQTTLSRYGQTSDTLVMPLTIEPNVAVTRRQARDYTEKVSGSKLERLYSYEITVKNNRDYPMELTVKDQYPVPVSAEVDVKLIQSSGAEVNAPEGFLTWKLDLAPGEQQILGFSYTIKYPKEGHIGF